MTGEYPATIVSHDFFTTQKGTFALAVKANVRTPLGEDELQGFIWFTEKAMGMARAQLKEIGFDCDNQNLNDLGTKVSLVGNKCTVTVEEREFKGQTETRIARFGIGRRVLTNDEKAKIQKALRAAKKAQPELELDTPIDMDIKDEDIPF